MPASLPTLRLKSKGQNDDPTAFSPMGGLSAHTTTKKSKGQKKVGNLGERKWNNQIAVKDQAFPLKISFYSYLVKDS